MRESRLFVFIIAWVLVASADSLGFTQADDKQKLSKDVSRVFQTICAQCHDPGGENPKALKKWKNAADVQELIDREYVVPGKPDDSDLLMILELGDMPPKDSKVPPLKKEELEIVRAWIAGGAPVPKPQETSDTADAASSSESLGIIWRTVRWLGRFHPILVHFPIAFILGALIAELLGLWSLLGMKEHSHGIVRFCLIFGALGGVAASVTGWMNAEFVHHSGNLGWILLFHRWIGPTISVITVIACIALYRAGKKDGSRRTLRFLLFLDAFLVGVQGALGGMLVYGIDHFAW